MDHQRLRQAPATDDSSDSPRRWRNSFVLMLTLMMAGCQHLELLAEPELYDGPTAGAAGSDSPRLRRELDMNGQWQNRRLSELVAALGEPQLIMNIPGGGNPPGFVVVYWLDPPTGCIDAFALLYGRDPPIRIYHCR